MSSPHVLAIPFPAQGHVIPLLELSQCLVKHGCRVTFVNTDCDHKRVVDALSEDNLEDRIRLVSIPDGMDPSEDRTIMWRLCESVLEVMPGKLRELMEKIIGEGDVIDCVIGDGCLGFAMQVAKKMNIRRAIFWPSCAASLALSFSIPQLVADGIVDNQGMITKKQMVQLAPNMPKTSSENLIWVGGDGDLSTQKAFFNLLLRTNEDIKMAQISLSNSTYDLEPQALSLIPNILPIGPLLASNRLGTSAGSFWPADEECLNWLDKQAINSIVYIAFGSHAVFDPIQFRELALGLGLSGRPFLWAVRPDKNMSFPEEFKECLDVRGRLMGWAPQQKVLSHPSVACFISHCGWNSTTESVANGVPFLCWPYFSDQYWNESYVCDVWKVGLRLKKNGDGIVTSSEIKEKLDRLLSNGGFKIGSLEIRKRILNSLKEGGQINQNFKRLMDWIKE